MKQTLEKDVRRCGCCHRELPLDAFYMVNKQTSAFDNYCKACRKELSATRYYRSLPTDEPPRYPVITKTEDKELRMHLIMNALQVVRASVLRKRRREVRD